MSREELSRIGYNKIMNIPTDRFDRQAWDKRIQILDGGILQGAGWADFQESINRPTLRESGSNWAWQGFVRSSRGLKYLIVPYGPLVHSNASAAIQSVLTQARAAGCDFVRFEPRGTISLTEIKSHGGRQIGEVQPQHTFVLDLTPTEEELRKNLQSGHRNRINTTAKRGITIRQVKDMSPMDDFLRLMADTAAHAHIVNHPDWYYRSMAEVLVGEGIASFYVSEVAGQVASVSLVYDWGDTRSYAHTGNSQALNREYKVAVSAAWQMILDAKSAGLTKFDFWGAAPDDNPAHKWAGITSFKKAFGGELVSTLGSWDVPLKQHKYRAYHFYRKLRGREA